MHRTPRHLLAGFVVLTAAGIAAACSLAQLGSTAPDAATPTAAQMVLPPRPVQPVVRTVAKPKKAAALPVLRLQAARNPKKGLIVVDTRGLTLYRSAKDSAAPPASRCVGTCLKTWKPVLADGVRIAVKGIRPTAVGSITRADGTHQVTIGGWPVYRFVKDTKPGDITGNCKGGFAVLKVASNAM